MTDSLKAPTFLQDIRQINGRFRRVLFIDGYFSAAVSCILMINYFASPPFTGSERRFMTTRGTFSKIAFSPPPGLECCQNLFLELRTFAPFRKTTPPPTHPLFPASRLRCAKIYRRSRWRYFNNLEEIWRPNIRGFSCRASRVNRQY